ncbi:hypothetical protein BH10ACT3_BH10ACT3_13870 [soil metagenome]
MSVTAERVGDLIVPILSDLGLSLYDLEYTGAAVKVLIDRDGGIDLAALTEATRKLSDALEEADVLPSAYTLEVSSPGLERTLRTPAHYAGAIGELVKVKKRSNTDGERRVEGLLTAADESAITVTADNGDQTVVPLADIDRARTHFVGDAAPKPGKGSRPGATAKSKKADPAQKGSGSAKKSSAAKSAAARAAADRSPRGPADETDAEPDLP